jgi:protein-tyrosine phosphatase
MIHCLAGVSRSVSLVLAFLIKHRGCTYLKAFDCVKSRRKIIHPNDGFIQQLKKFEIELQSQIPQSISLSPTKPPSQR